MNHVKIESSSLTSKLNAIDNEFKDFLSGLAFKREFGHDKLKTFSPIDAVEDFEMRGLSRVKEPSRNEMLSNEKGFNKLLANMLAQCQPGSLSDEDLIQITGINGREVLAGL